MDHDWRDELSPAVRRMLAEDTDDPDIQAYNDYRLQKYMPEYLKALERSEEAAADNDRDENDG